MSSAKMLECKTRVSDDYERPPLGRSPRRGARNASTVHPEGCHLFILLSSTFALHRRLR